MAAISNDVATGAPSEDMVRDAKARGDLDSSRIEAARSGDADAQADLAIVLFREGRRVEAMPWVRQAAAVGEPRCQYLLGVAMFNGDLVPQDRPRALRLLVEAARAGVTPAAAALAATGVRHVEEGSLLSNVAEAATRAAFARLAPPPVTAITLQSMVETILRPMLSEGLNILLPTTVDRQIENLVSG